jgi:hypothetical protein
VANTRSPRGTTHSIKPAPDVLNIVNPSDEHQIITQVPTAIGNPADAAPSTGRISAMSTAGEIGMKPTSTQARVLPILYVTGTLVLIDAAVFPPRVTRMVAVRLYHGSKARSKLCNLV